MGERIRMKPDSKCVIRTFINTQMVSSFIEGFIKEEIGAAKNGKIMILTLIHGERNDLRKLLYSDLTIKRKVGLPLILHKNLRGGGIKKYSVNRFFCVASNLFLLSDFIIKLPPNFSYFTE